MMKAGRFLWPRHINATLKETWRQPTAEQEHFGSMSKKNNNVLRSRRQICEVVNIQMSMPFLLGNCLELDACKLHYMI